MNTTADSVRTGEAFGGDGERDLLDFLVPFLLHWRLLVLVPLLAGLGALAITYLAAPTYTSRTTFLPPQQQQSSTAYMLFKVDELIADISQGITLEPGDIIATGTPAGVGAGRTPQEWLWPGDVVTCEIERIGRLRNPVVAA